MAHRAGRAIRDEAALRVSYAAPCPSCSHPMGRHHELQPEVIGLDFGGVEPVITSVPNPDYKPLHFHCDVDGCDCVHVHESVR